MVEIVSNQGCTVGEAPLWHPDDGRIYWTDNIGGVMYRYDPQSGTTEQFYAGELVAAFTIQDDGSLLLFREEGEICHWDDGEFTTIIQNIQQEKGMRFNDVIADPRGRVFCGTMDDDDPTAGQLYRLDKDGSIIEVLENVELSNGLGFNPERDMLYLTESNTNRIYKFNYDQSTGRISDREVFSERAGPGMYDGLTVDANGSIWSALWDYGAIVEHNPDSTVKQLIDLPTRNTTSLTFAGPEFTTAYVTSAALGTGEDDDAAGALFRVNPGVKGVPEFRSKISV